ncbi:MAG: transcriptional coactivator p15/PC4 family protein [Elusimicrobiaceae bacterium]|nr:transcriptional coactivator p15/PC4 family protein [Elusimicrobiaceae bacterium]
MSQSSFAVLHNIGTLPLDESSEVKFSIDSYRGYRYASIRKYLTSGSYTGATRAGITMTEEIVKAVAPLLAGLPDVPAQVKDVELGKFAKRPGMSVVVRVSTFQGAKGLDFRQWQEDNTYKGWTKKGIRLPVEKIKEIKALFAKMAQALQETPITDL